MSEGLEDAGLQSEETLGLGVPLGVTQGDGLWGHGPSPFGREPPRGEPGPIQEEQQYLVTK